VNTGGVWYLEGDDSIQSGNFDLKLWYHNQTSFVTGMFDNSFSILRRPLPSIDAAEWKLPRTGSQYIAGTIASGFVVRNKVTNFGQYGIGQTFYGVSAKSFVKNGSAFVNPNPFNNRLQVGIELISPVKVTIKLLDLTGRVVVEKELGMLNGNQNIQLQTEQLSEGIYTILISGNGYNLFTEKLIRINK